jgi:Rho termination factor, N-terminal domain
MKMEEAPKEKHVYKVGDKVVINFPSNGLGWAGGPIPSLDTPKKGDVLTLRGQSESGAWYTDEWHWWWDERAFSPYKEEKEEMVKPMLMKDLRAVAKQRKLPLYSRMNKAQLQAALIQKQAAPLAAKPLPKPVVPSLGKELRNRTGDDPGTCSYALEFTGGYRRFQVRDVCHARLKKAGRWDENEEKEKSLSIVAAVCDIAGHYNEVEKKDVYKRAILYLLNHSPYKNTYITKNWDDVMCEGVYLNVTVESHSRCVAGAIALREASEFPAQLEMFKLLTNDGFDDSLAWFACRHFRIGDGVYVFSPNTGGHATLSCSMNWEQLKKFWKEGFHIGKDVPMSEKAVNYSIFESISPIVYGDAGTLQQKLKKVFNVVEDKKAAWDSPMKKLSKRQLFAGLEILAKELA